MHVTHHASRSLLLTLCLLCCIALTACGNSTTRYIGTAVTPQPTPTSAAPTSTPWRMPTLIPTNTPLTLDQQLQHVTLTAVQAVTVGRHATVDAFFGVVIETEMLDDCCTRVDDIHLECFNLMNAIWHDSMSSHIKVVQIHLEGNLVDQYGRPSIGDVGRCMLTRDTEKKFVWDNLNQDSAWEVYDYTWTLPSLQ
jgi:hypothetical protein